MVYKNNDMYSWEEREEILTSLLGFVHGMVPEYDKGNFKGFGTCNHCHFKDIIAEREDHPEGLGEVLVGCQWGCKKDCKPPKEMWLQGGELVTREPCVYFVPEICELCNILGFRENRECDTCIWREE